MSLLVLCPTRSRPHKALELLSTFLATRATLDTQLVFVVDEDDPQRDDYLESLPSANVEVNEEIGSMVRALNSSAIQHATIGVYDYLGFVGDDHRFRSKDWDLAMTDRLSQIGGGFAYANDLYQGENLPTQCIISTPIIAALGWMAPPTLKHLYVDDAWKLLGTEAGCLSYLPEVIIEHVHPYAGKAEMDAGYERVNSREMDAHDREAFNQWVMGSAQEDVAKVRAARA